MKEEIIKILKIYPRIIATSIFVIGSAMAFYGFCSMNQYRETYLVLICIMCIMAGAVIGAYGLTVFFYKQDVIGLFKSLFQIK